MSGSWWAKASFIMFAILLSFYVLLPSFLGEGAYSRLSKQVATVSNEQAAESTTVGKWWQGLLPDTAINLGLDLQGGIELTLKVETDEAVISMVQRDLDPLKDLAAKEGIRLKDVRRVRGEPSMQVLPEEGVASDAILQFIKRRIGDYEFEGDRVDADGTWLIYTMSEAQQDGIGRNAVQQALEMLRNRINETGVKEPSIVLKGGNRINVQLPGIDNLQQAVAAIGTTAVLQFMLVDEDFGADKLEKALIQAEKQLEPDVLNDDKSLSEWMVRTGRIPEADRLIWEYEKNAEGKDVRKDPMVIKEDIMLTGDDISDAQVSMNQYNEPYVGLEFKPRGGRIFGEVTGENVGKRFAIVLDDKLRSAPVIREKIAGGRASIEMGQGDYNQLMQEASVLSLVLRTGALPAPVSIGEVRTVGASLGADSIREALLAGALGISMVFAFTMIYYRKVGVLAVGALVLNILFLVALLAGVGATLTLPGITGIALTVGMAIDANIIINERIREEMKAGKNARAATDAGFEKAFSAVFDGNATTFIAGVVLYSYGTGPIKGFAVTLMLGIVTTLFANVFCARTMMEAYTRRAAARLDY